MISMFRMSESARVAVIGDVTGVHLYLVSGASRLGIQLATPAARAVETELREHLPPGEPVTRRPAVPRERSHQPDWSRIVARLRAGKPIPSDAEHVAGLLSYLGVRCNEEPATPRLRELRAPRAG